jgi:hypothetical protein
VESIPVLQELEATDILGRLQGMYMEVVVVADIGVLQTAAEQVVPAEAVKVVAELHQLYMHL